MTSREFWKSITEQRFTGCWHISKRKHPLSVHYSTVQVDGVKTTAHRYAWTVKKGPIPAGLMVLHRCDNPQCCNPKHLFLGTARDNTLDAIKKGRLRPPYRRPRKFEYRPDVARLTR